MADREERVLLGGLGLNISNDVTYTLGKRSEKAYCSLTALARLVDQPPDRIVVVTTREALAKHEPSLRGELPAPQLEFLEAQPASGTDLTVLYRELFNRVRGASELVLDLTGGMRSLTFLFHWVAAFFDAYRSSGRQSALAGCYYCMLDRERRDAEVVDLGDFLAALDWTKAVATFNRYGLLAPLRDVVDVRVAQLRKRSGNGRDPALHRLGRLRNGVVNLSPAVDMGLSVQAAKEARKIIDTHKDLDKEEFQQHLPLGSEALDALIHAVCPLAAKSTGDPQLDRDELQRELDLAGWYADRARPERALLMLREWIVNRVVFAQPDEQVDWLDYKVRHLAERKLNALSERQKSDSSLLAKDDPRSSDLASTWGSVADARNQVAHCGYKKEPAKPERLTKKVKSLLNKLTKLNTENEIWRLPLHGGEGRVLIQGLGHSPGVIYTSLRAFRPDKLVVLETETSAALLEEALVRVPEITPDLTRVMLSDPWKAHELMDTVLHEHKDLARTLCGADEVIGVMTGGTTGMTALVARLADYAERFGVKVKRVLLIDPRTPQEQQKNPWHEGEVAEL